MKTLLFTMICVFSMTGGGATFNDVIASEPIITEAEIAETSDTILVAMITEPIFLKSEGDALEARVQRKIEKIIPEKNIIVTRDSVVYYGLKRAVKNNDKDGISKLVYEQKQRSEAKSKKVS